MLQPIDLPKEPTTIDHLEQAQQAYDAARAQAKQAQMFNFLNQIRVLHIGLLLANMNGELALEFKDDARKQMLQVVAGLEVEDVG